jgi:hypothetical protein
MSKSDDNLLSSDPKIDILLCNQNNWVLENMCRTSLTGFNALKEFLQTIKNCFEPHIYLDHYLNLVKDVEYDLVFWSNQYGMNSKLLVFCKLETSFIEKLGFNDENSLNKSLKFFK